MTVRRKLLAGAALLALWLGAGCSGGDAGPMPAETDEQAFRVGQQRLREGRAPEALTWFLKVIEKRGTQNSPESHLEAGRIFLQHSRDPIEAYHHFRKYLELQPNSQQANLVRQQVDAAKLQFASQLPLRPEENQVRFENAEELARLKRENDELRAELATLRGGRAVPVAARSSRMIAVPDAPRTAPAIPSEISPITAVPVTPPRPVSQPPIRAAAAPGSNAKAGSASGRTHIVVQGEGAWAIARKYYGASPSALQVQGILDANRVTAAELKPGMTLRIP